ncbi:hypothetical protein [Nitrincola alkalisediminis]|uniref:hypothetical protein n=1 Tax=Nitrincola alkalisediminis TaxID=1366656 RepID=UPI001CA8D097|nr:hypothetical protein [Nitrincola alkalisediminis]
MFKSLIALKSVDVSWNLLDGVVPNDFERIKLDHSDRVLILLDQEKGIEDDRYPLTKSLVARCAVQHINVNPHDVTGDPVEKGLLIESKRDDDPIKLYVAYEGGYYNYNNDLLDTKDYKEAIIRKLEVVLKELELKRLLIDSDRPISQVLPLQRACLNESTIVITDGYLFTVSNDRPVLIPFDPTDSDMTSKANEYLSNFETSVDDLLNLMNENWPYSYRQNVVMDYYGSEVDKQRRFAARITLVLSRGEDAQVSIMMQDPSYDQPNVLPLGMEDVYWSTKTGHFF